jgi:hypothetical protein
MYYSFQRCARRRRRRGDAARNRANENRKAGRPGRASACCQRKRKGPEVPNTLTGETAGLDEFAAQPGKQVSIGAVDALSTGQACEERPRAQERVEKTFDKSLACHGHGHEVDKNPSRGAKSAPRRRR